MKKLFNGVLFSVLLAALCLSSAYATWLNTSTVKAVCSESENYPINKYNNNIVPEYNGEMPNPTPRTRRYQNPNSNKDNKNIIPKNNRELPENTPENKGFREHYPKKDNKNITPRYNREPKKRRYQNPNPNKDNNNIPEYNSKLPKTAPKNRGFEEQNPKKDNKNINPKNNRELPDPTPETKGFENQYPKREYRNPKNKDLPGKPFPRPPRGHGKWQRPPNNGKAIPGPVSAAEYSAANAKAAYLMDYGSKKPLFAQNENKRFPIASMCKIMSLILIYEKIDQGKIKEDDFIIVSEQASGMGGSQVFLEANGKYKIGDLIKSIVVSSANDSTVAMAEHIAGSEEGFVVLMNKRAKDLGLNDTNFTNCTGLPQPGQYSSARDCAFMLSELISHKDYFKYSRIWMDKMIHSAGRETEMTNTNKLVRFYKGCDGGKTGYTSEAKHCVTVTAQREGMRLISVIIGAESSKVRFGEASKLLNYGFANYQSMPIIKSDTLLEIELEVKGGKQKTLTLQAEEDFSYLAKKFDSINYGIDYNLPKNISAPIKKGEVVGKLSVVIDNQVLKEINVLAACDIDCRTYADALGEILHCW